MSLLVVALSLDMLGVFSLLYVLVGYGSITFDHIHKQFLLSYYYTSFSSLALLLPYVLLSIFFLHCIELFSFPP